MNESDDRTGSSQQTDKSASLLETNHLGQSSKCEPKVTMEGDSSGISESSVKSHHDIINVMRVELKESGDFGKRNHSWKPSDSSSNFALLEKTVEIYKTKIKEHQNALNDKEAVIKEIKYQFMREKENWVVTESHLRRDVENLASRIQEMIGCVRNENFHGGLSCCKEQHALQNELNRYQNDRAGLAKKLAITEVLLCNSNAEKEKERGDLEEALLLEKEARCQAEKRLEQLMEKENVLLVQMKDLQKKMRTEEETRQVLEINENEMVEKLAAVEGQLVVVKLELVNTQSKAANEVENLNVQLQLMSEKLASKLEEMSSLKKSHEQEMLPLTQAVDDLERNQREDHSQFISHIESLTEAKKSLAEQLKCSTESIQLLKEEEQNRKEQLVAKDEQLNQLNRRLTELDNLLSDSKDQLVKMTLNFDEAVDNLTKMSSEVTLLKSSKQEMNVQLQALGDKLHEAEDRCSHLESEKLSLTTEKLNWTTEKNMLFSNLECIEELQEELTRLEEVGKEKSQLEITLDECHRRNSELEESCSRLASFEIQSCELSEKLAFVTDRFSEAQNRLKIVEGLDEQIKCLMTRCTELEKELEQQCLVFTKQIGGLETRVGTADSLVKQVEEQTSKCESLESELIGLRTQLLEKNENVENLGFKLVEGETMREILQKEKDALERGKEMLEKDHSECETERDKVVEEYNTLKEQMTATLLTLEQGHQSSESNSSQRIRTVDVGTDASPLMAVLPRAFGDVVHADVLGVSMQKFETSQDKNVATFNKLTGVIKSLENENSVLKQHLKEFDEKRKGLVSPHHECEHFSEIYGNGENQSLKEVALVPGVTHEHWKNELSVGERADTSNHQLYLTELEDVAVNAFTQSQAEKLRLLEDQKSMTLKLMRENQIKMHKICQTFADNLSSLSTAEDAKQILSSLTSALENASAEEVTWVDQQYSQLLLQYSHEQGLQAQSQYLVVAELKERLAVLLQEQQDKILQMERDHETEIVHLNERHEAALQCLDNQLMTGREMGHELGWADERNWYRKTVDLLSSITLQLLYYYSVAQVYARSLRKAEECQSTDYEDRRWSTLDMSVERGFNVSSVSEENPAHIYGGGRNGGETVDFTLDPFIEPRSIRTSFKVGDVPGESSDYEDLIPPALDSTGLSDGLLEEVEQGSLAASYPRLMSLLRAGGQGHDSKGVCTRILAQEIQELTISLQASAGMLRILMLSAGAVTAPVIQDVVIENSHECLVGNGFESGKDAGVENELFNLSEGLISELAEQKDGIPEKSAIKGSASDLLSALELISLRTGLDDSDKQVLDKLKKELEQNLELNGEISHLTSLLAAAKDDLRHLEDENTQIERSNCSLAIKLQASECHIDDLKKQLQPRADSMSPPSKLESFGTIKDKVRAILSAKDKTQLGRRELEARIVELETTLDEAVTEREATVEVLTTRLADLDQQLEVADRQLRSTRKFNEETASERDQELNELVRSNELMTTQLREKESAVAYQSELIKEVEQLEHDLQAKVIELQDVYTDNEELHCAIKSAEAKIKELRETMHSLESQLEVKCCQIEEQFAHMEKLKFELSALQQTIQKSHTQAGTEEMNDTNVSDSLSVHKMQKNDVDFEEDGERQRNLSMELSDVARESSLSLLQMVESQVDRTTRGLEALQLSLSNSSLHSDEDFSIKDHLGSSSFLPGLDTPATVEALERRLEEKMSALEGTTEAAVKRTRDLELALKKTRREIEEVTAERDILQTQCNDNLLQICSLRTRLEELVRSDQQPIAAELRVKASMLQQENDRLQKELLRKVQESNELKHSVQETRNLLQSREEELRRLKRGPVMGQEDLMSQLKQVQKQLLNEQSLVNKFKVELSKAKKDINDDGMSPEVSKKLIEEKNVEIDTLSHQILDMRKEIKRALHFTSDWNEARCVLERMLTQKSSWISRSDGEESPEILRRMSFNSLTYDPVARMKGKIPSRHLQWDTDSSSHSCVTLERPESAQLTSTSEVSLISEQPVMSPNWSQAGEIRDLEVSIRTNLTDEKQVKLEEDFSMAQHLLEERDAEIEKLTEEAVDAVPSKADSTYLKEIEEKVSMLEKKLSTTEQVRLSMLHENQQLATLKSQLEEQLTSVQCQLTAEMEERNRSWEEKKKELLQQMEINEKLVFDKNEELHRLWLLMEEQHNQNGRIQAELRNEVVSLREQLELLEQQLKGQKLEHEATELAVIPQPSPLTTPFMHLAETPISDIMRELNVASRDSFDLDDSVVADAVRRLVRKVHQEGLEVLSLTEKDFLRRYKSQFDQSDLPDVAAINLLSCEDEESMQCLLQRVQQLQTELNAREQEMKTRVALLEFQRDEEAHISLEWQKRNQTEKKMYLELMNELHRERILAGDKSTEVSLLTAQLEMLRTQCGNVEEENQELRCSLEECEKRLKTATDTLKDEQKNCARVSASLNQQRQLAANSTAQSNQVILELRSSLEDERNLISDLLKELGEVRTQSRERSTFGSPATAVTDRLSITRELQAQLTIERENMRDVQQNYEELQSNYQDLLVRYEGGRRELMQALQQHAEFVECDNQLQSLCAEQVLHEDQKPIAELEQLAQKLEVEGAALAHQARVEQDRSNRLDHELASLREQVTHWRDRFHALHTNHTVELEKHADGVKWDRMQQGQLDAVGREAASLRQQVNSLRRELAQKEQCEESLRKQLETHGRQSGLDETTSANHVEMFASLLRHNEEDSTLRRQVISLQAEVQRLTSKIKRMSPRGESSDALLNLQVALEKAQVETKHLKGELVKTQLKCKHEGRCCQDRLDDAVKRQVLQSKYLRSESRWKALVWQKEYLKRLVEGYQGTETYTLARLDVLTSHSVNNQREAAGEWQMSSSNTTISRATRRFRAAAIVVIAIARMKNLVQRWRRRLSPDFGVKPGVRGSIGSGTSSRPGSASSATSVPSPLPTASNWGITGSTPPTKDVPISLPVGTSQRNLFRVELSPSDNFFRW